MSEKMVQIPQEAFDSLLARIDSLEKGGTVIKPKRVSTRTAKLRTWNEKIVSGVKKVYEEINQRTQKEETKCDITVRNGEKEEIITGLDYLKFLNEAGILIADVVSEKAEKKEKIVGTINKVDRANDRILPEVIELKTNYIEYHAKLKVTTEGDFQGTEIELPGSALNI